ncbi:hypothetical protein Clacol_010586 [Clathrus columnatus]|uniref:C2 NT-type domain-containing protein n=1 Tax=Clathrus columnatus TaxID=1419009 RepID=A0AAV5AP56_9AGAM|nr:hypothetical protein Clacol_010586 [Clathrus columnatus]
MSLLQQPELPSTSTSSIHTTESRFTHLRDFLPFQKHAIFRVDLLIHELQSVPFISGEFRIKWKFEDLQAVSSDGRPLGFGRALALKLEKRKNNNERKGKQKLVVLEGSSLDLEKNPAIGSSPQIPILDLPESPNPSPPPLPQRQNSTHSHLSNDPQSSSSNANFKVIFESQINAAVQMTIEKETLALLPSRLKLTVMQHVIPGDLGAPLNPRLGHIELNLAEYANVGPITRRYLLRRSKVNALLKLTLTVVQISGEKNYRAPPLRKQEIKANLMDFVNNGKPPSPPMFSSLDEDPWLEGILPEIFRLEDDEGEAEGFPDVPQISLPPLKPKKRWRNGRAPDFTPADPTTTATTTTTDPLFLKPKVPRQPNSTEMLVEAIFNPFPTSSHTPSPFTYHATYDPLPKLVKNDSSNSTSEGLGTDGTSRGSFDSSQHISVSGSDLGHDGASSTGAASVSGHSSGKPWWRRRIGQHSRPTTPSLLS